MHTARNVQKISLLFFIILGLGYFISTLMMQQGYGAKETALLAETLDIPFILAGAAYGASSIRLRLGLEGRAGLMYDIAATIIILAITGGLLYLNIAFPNQ